MPRIRTHQNSDLALVGKPVIIDKPSTAHFSFNDNMVGGGYNLYPLVDPVTRELSGASNAVPAYDQLYTNQSIQGLYGYGLQRAELSTNLASTTASRTLSLHEGYSHAGAGSSLAPEKGPGWYKFQISHRGTNLRIAQFPYITQTLNTTRAYSVEFDLGTTTGYFLRIDGTTSCDGTTSGGKWTAVFTPTGTGSYAIFLNNNTYNVDVTDTIYYKYYQVEAKAYSTDFTTGSRAEAYVSYQPYPTKVWSSWVRSTSPKICTHPAKRTIMKQYDSLTNIGWWLYIAPSGDPLYTAGTAVLEIISNGLPTLRCNVAHDIKDTSMWHQISVELDTTSYSAAYKTARLWVNDQYSEIGDLSTYNLNYTLVPINVGYADISDTAGNFIYDEMRLDQGTYAYDDMRRRYLSATEYFNPYSYGITCI